MSNNKRILNVTRGFTLKHKQALKAVDECACTWVEFGVSIRDLTLAESIAARNEQARLAEPLPFAEIPGLIFMPPVSTTVSRAHEMKIAGLAYQFAAAR